MLHDILNRFHLVDRKGVGSRCFLETEEIAQENGRFFLVNQLGPFLELLVVTCAGSQLQLGNGFRVPCMLDAIFPPVELTEVG